MDRASPPVSPKVVAAILMIQKTNVTVGTLLVATCLWSIIISSPLVEMYGVPTRLVPMRWGLVGFGSTEIDPRAAPNARART